MTEDFLHYIWKNRLFNSSDLHTTDGHCLTIIGTGFPHHDAGPDFKQAIVKIGEITWVGDVEIHINSSDWVKHHHQDDPKYLTVTLHVVFNHDSEIYRTAQERFPTLELKNLIEPSLWQGYCKLALSEQTIACAAEITNISSLQFASLCSSMVIDRLLNKQKMIFEMLEHCRYDWNETFFRLLTLSFGFKINVAAFELLGKSLPFKYLIKHANTKLQTYALVFGQSGLLEEKKTEDLYYVSLQNEYQYLKNKYQLIPIDKKCWNLLRLRPLNFPCIRLAQLCEIVHRHPLLFKRITEENKIENYFDWLGCTPHLYWENHFYFGKLSKKHQASIGKEAIELIIINTIVPALFAYGYFAGEEQYQEKAVSLLEKLHFENNYITRRYQL
ncbi:MAG: DUF2851 family protein, partial [Bacteroidales bacterium]